MGVPAIGDVQLVPSKTPGYYQPLVYFTNGIEPPQWGAICYDGVVKADARVLCNQAGFELNDISSFIGLEYVRYTKVLGRYFLIINLQFFTIGQTDQCMLTLYCTCINILHSCRAWCAHAFIYIMSST